MIVCGGASDGASGCDAGAAPAARAGIAYTLQYEYHTRRTGARSRIRAHCAVDSRILRTRIHYLIVIELSYINYYYSTRLPLDGFLTA